MRQLRARNDFGPGDFFKGLLPLKQGLGDHSPHYLLLQRVPRQDAINIDNPFLANAMRAVHGLEVLHGVPVVLHEDHRVCSGEVEAQAADGRGHHEAVDGRVAVEPARQQRLQIHESS